MKHNESDVIIIGAGLTGLSAANRLIEDGFHVTVLEAMERAGGKVESVEKESGWFERGPQFVNDDMSEMVKLIERAGMTLAETTIADNAAMIHAETKEDADQRTEPLVPKLFATHLTDDIPLAQLYANAGMNDTSLSIIRSMQTELVTIEPDQLSAIALIDTNNRYPSEKSDLTHQASGPLGTVITYLADRLEDHLIYEAPVTHVRTSDKMYTVHTKNEQYTAPAVIVALPPAVATSLNYPEEVEYQFRDALSSYTNGAIVKVTWQFEQPFWNDLHAKNTEKPMAGLVFTNPEGITVSVSSKANGQPRLTMFIGGNEAKRFSTMNEKERIHEATRLLAMGVGSAAYDYTDATDSVWVDHPYCGGGYGASVHFGGQPDAAEHLRLPYERFLFASSETATEFPNFMEGAVRAGIRAAMNIK
ncbi:hypothetical protein JCM19037_2892 [Geomicrobium sp. JCM 19037]|uniref:flavin monoamine oxidase family protein n=1 Tax=Geomicrobium sp. JCM 19037 TaxID=1460634 RepID=UPI00045F3E9B|nr:oleate hydratase [Geomicrobium sp. JCM 19037]GAK04471.1 hypothetical protein JCM19037_2892 [Geomicrobium sp. JCM 19037]